MDENEWTSVRGMNAGMSKQRLQCGCLLACADVDVQLQMRLHLFQGRVCVVSVVGWVERMRWVCAACVTPIVRFVVCEVMMDFVQHGFVVRSPTHLCVV